MEIQYDNTFNVCFASLWNTLKKFRIAFTICVFIVFFLVDLFITAISGMGSPTGNSGRSGREVALYLFPVLLFAGTVIASLAMWDAGDEHGENGLHRKVSVFMEWFVRWLIYVLLPFLFMIFGIYFMDAFIAGRSNECIAIEGFGFDDMSKAYGFPTYLFVVSLYFLGATYFKRYAIVAVSLIAGVLGFILLQILPNRIWYTSEPTVPSYGVIAFLIGMSICAFVLSYVNLRILRRQNSDRQVGS